MMLTSSAISAAEQVVQSLKNKGVALVPREGTLIAGLNTASIGAKTFNDVSHKASMVPMESMVVDSKGNGDASEHDIVMEEAVRLNANVLNNLLGVVRNELMPIAKDIVTRFDEKMDITRMKITDPFALIPNNYHRIWELNQLHGYIERFENIPFVQVRVDRAFPMVETFDLLAMVRTGIKTLDAVIEEWLGDMAPEKLANVWKNVFVDRIWSVGRQTGAQHMNEQGMDRNDILMTFLLANGLEDAMPSGINMPLDQLRSICSRVRSAAGRAVNAEIARRERDIKNNILIYKSERQKDDYNTTEGKMVVFVNGDVFTRFLSEGGSTEAIFGAIINGGSLTFNAIRENQQFLEELYMKNKKIYDQNSSAILFRAQKDSISMAFTDYINSTDEDKLPAVRSAVHKVLSDEIGCLEPIDLKDIATAIRNLVCRVLFCETNAEMFLKAMDAAEVENPGLDPREHAELAKIDLQARWVADQIIAKKALA